MKAKKKRKKYKASEQLEAMASQWADNKSIMIIGGVGENKAISIRRKIETSIKEKGYKLPRQAIVPMRCVIDYFDIDINYLKRLSKLERGK